MVKRYKTFDPQLVFVEQASDSAVADANDAQSGKTEPRKPFKPYDPYAPQPVINMQPPNGTIERVGQRLAGKAGPEQNSDPSYWPSNKNGIIAPGGQIGSSWKPDPKADNSPYTPYKPDWMSDNKNPNWSDAKTKAWQDYKDGQVPVDKWKDNEWGGKTSPSGIHANPATLDTSKWVNGQPPDMTKGAGQDWPQGTTQNEKPSFLRKNKLPITNESKLSLYKKSQKSGIPTNILETVYYRGYNIWNESFGQTPEQFAFDRVNSFIAGGFARNLDDDLINEDGKGYKNPTGGLTQKGRDHYNKETGGHLKAPVTTPPSKLKAGSKSANRRKSFCARMGGVEGPMKKPNGEPTRKALALRKWNCEETQIDEKRGLWDNIHAKRERIKHGSGEHMRKPGSKGAPTAAALKNSQIKEEEDSGEYFRKNPPPKSAVTDFMNNNLPVISQAKTAVGMADKIKNKDYKGAALDTLEQIPKVGIAVGAARTLAREAFSGDYMKQGREYLKLKRAKEKASKNPQPKLTSTDTNDLVQQYLAKGGQVKTIKETVKSLVFEKRKAEYESGSEQSAVSDVGNRLRGNRQINPDGFKQGMSKALNAYDDATENNPVASTVADWTPGVSNVKGAADALNSYRKGDALGVGLGALQTATGSFAPAIYRGAKATGSAIKNFVVREESDDDGEAVAGETTDSAMSRMNKKKTDQEKADFLGNYMKSALDKGGFTNGKFSAMANKQKVNEGKGDKFDFGDEEPTPQRKTTQTAPSETPAPARSSASTTSTGGDTKVDANDASNRIQQKYGWVPGISSYTNPETLKQYAKSVDIPVRGNTIGSDTPQSSNDLSRKIKDRYNYDISPEKIRDYAKTFNIKVNEAYEMIVNMIESEQGGKHFKNNETSEPQSNNPNDSDSRFDGTTSGANVYAKETPGQKNRDKPKSVTNKTIKRTLKEMLGRR